MKRKEDCGSKTGTVCGDFVHPVQIGNLHIKNNVFLAPLAGVADRAFRLVCREQGAGFSYSEMISAKGVHYRSAASVELGILDPGEYPGAVQLFGSEPELMAEAACRFAEMGAAAIDINMGCPMPKITSNGEGSALMKDPALAGRIVKAVSGAVPVPVTVKLRRGYAVGGETAAELAAAAEANGAAAVAVHGRYRDEFYTGHADLAVIAAVKRSVKIPVIGNGDIVSAETARRMFDETGCDAVMIGRGAFGNPWIFREVISGGAPPEPRERLAGILHHLALAVTFKGEDVGLREMRKHVAWYLKGLRGAAAVRGQVFQMTRKEELLELLNRFFRAYNDM